MENYQDTEDKILGTLLRQPLENKSLRQIAIDTELSYVTVHKVAPRLLKRQLLQLLKKGKASLVSIDFEHADLDSLSSAMLYKKNIFLRKHPQLMFLVSEIEETLTGMIYSLL